MLVKTRLPLAFRGAAPFQSLREEMDRLFNDWLTEVDLPEGGGTGGFIPRLDVVETESGLTVKAELPGMEMADLEVDLDSRLLTITGRKDEVHEEKGESFHRRERHFGAFTRQVALPWEVDPNAIEPTATLNNGLLTVTVPKPAEAPTSRRKIEVAAG